MTDDPRQRIQSAEVLLPTTDLAADLAFFTDTLGFRVDLVLPADDPREVVCSGHGVRLRLLRGATSAPGVLRLICDADDPTLLPRPSVAPNGTRVEWVAATLPPPAATWPTAPQIYRQADAADWIAGRAGMSYRNLLPRGGPLGASHIRVADGGPVADYVHYHEVRFQMIYCYSGWVRVAYEDQGPPLTMHVGDCVLQPPGIRHRVLDCSPGLEVIEASSPAEHLTRADHETKLPGEDCHPDRLFDGQRFVHHVAAQAEWHPHRSGFEIRDTGIATATGNLADVRVVRIAAPDKAAELHTVDADLRLVFVTRGKVVVRFDGAETTQLQAGDRFAAPRGAQPAMASGSTDAELLEVDLGPG